MSSPAALTIGELAAASGRTPSSIRYYESIGLLPAPARSSGRRRYPPETVRTLAVVDGAQRAGPALNEIAVLLESTPGAAADLRAIAERRLPELPAPRERATLARDCLDSP